MPDTKLGKAAEQYHKDNPGKPIIGKKTDLKVGAEAYSARHNTHLLLRKNRPMVEVDAGRLHGDPHEDIK